MKKKDILTFLVSFCLAAGAAAWVFAPGEDPGRSVGGNAPGEDPGQSGGGSAVSDVLHRANGFSSEAWSGATAAGTAAPAAARPLIVIDAGHGGMDGGASAKDGTQEKDINLAIAEYLAEEIRQYPAEVLLTRESDAGLYTDDGRTIREKKREDLKRRKEIMQQPGVTLAISIHLNSFPQNENVYGAQVFYPKNQEVGTDVQAENSLSRITSKTFAEAVQKSLETNISDGRERAAMAKNDILLFKNSTGNMILAECGFLSNPQEAEKLKTAEYQQVLSKAIWQGVNEILCLEMNKKMEIRDSANNAK